LISLARSLRDADLKTPVDAEKASHRRGAEAAERKKKLTAANTEIHGEKDPPKTGVASEHSVFLRVLRGEFSSLQSLRLCGEVFEFGRQVALQY